MFAAQKKVIVSSKQNFIFFTFVLWLKIQKAKKKDYIAAYCVL